MRPSPASERQVLGSMVRMHLPTSQARPRIVVTLKFQTSILQSKCFLTLLDNCDINKFQFAG